MITQMKCVEKILWVKAKLKAIVLRKMLFLFDIQNGKETFIPKELGL
jgi:hypothetical protein